MQSTGERIYNLRIEQGLSLVEIEKRTGINRTTIMRWENGNTKNMRQDKVELLAEALNVSPAYIMGLTDDKHYIPHDYAITLSLDDLDNKVLIEEILASDNQVTIRHSNRLLYYATCISQFLKLSDKDKKTISDLVNSLSGGGDKG